MRPSLLVLVLVLAACERGSSPRYALPPMSGYQPPLVSNAPTPLASATEALHAAPLPRQPCETLAVGEFRPVQGEVQASGAIERRITRQMAEFSQLVQNGGELVVFKDEEGTGADRLMAHGLQEKLAALGLLVQEEWPHVRLRVTEAWDENGEHGEQSLHYEGRAADMTTSDRDPQKLGCLASLAVRAGFDWVYREGTSHVHASVKR